MRGRTTAGALLVVGVALIGAAVALVAITEETLERNVRSAARFRANEISVLLEGGTIPSELGIGNEEDAIVQILDGSGNVLASPPKLEGKPPIVQISPGESLIVETLPVPYDDSFMIVAESAGPLTVIVARNFDGVGESVSVLTEILLVVVPLLLTVVGVTAWRIVGRALAPVEAIRGEVAEISATELHRRVPLPSGDDEISRLARTMNGMLERLDESQARQQRLVSDASHEIRSPIAAIRHHAEVAIAHPGQTTVGDLASDVLSEDLRLERLAEDLLLLAKADEHSLQITARPLDLDDLVLEEARRLRQMTKLRIDVTGVSGARTRGDRQQLRRVVRNLADNAAGHASTAIRMAVRETGTNVVLEVDDDGPGIAEELRSAVFERFTRLDDARDRQHGGAGLGLAIVAEIVAAHGGSASVKDAPLGGARFEVILPRSQAVGTTARAFREGSGRKP